MYSVDLRKVGELIEFIFLLQLLKVIGALLYFEDAFAFIFWLFAMKYIFQHLNMIYNHVAPIHSQATVAPIPVRPFQQHSPHISFQDPFPLKSSDHSSLGTTSHVGRVGSALGMVNPSINSPTDCHSSQTSHSTHGVGKRKRILNET